MATNDTPPAWADSKDSWAGRVHDAVLPSGMKVTFRYLSIAEMVEVGELPTELLEVAIAEWDEPGSSVQLARAPLDELAELEKPTKKQQAAAEEASRAVARNIAALNRRVIAAALVEPKLTAEELKVVPYPDLELLAALINRTAHTDAAGRHVGVVLVERFRVVLEAHGHQPCPPDCEACEEARRGLATPR